jgi:hypothetical protein
MVMKNTTNRRLQPATAVMLPGDADVAGHSYLVSKGSSQAAAWPHPLRDVHPALAHACEAAQALVQQAAYALSLRLDLRIQARGEEAR